MPGTNQALRAARLTAEYQRDRAKLKATARTCHLCGERIDKALPPRHPLSFSADHNPPLNSAPPGQWRGVLLPAHYGCNASAGDGTKRSRTRLGTSQRW